MKIYSPKQWKKRRIFSRSISSELISVQPMEAPTGIGLQFYLDFKYENIHSKTIKRSQ